MSASFPTITDSFSPVASPLKQNSPSRAPLQTPTPGDGFNFSELARDIASTPSSQLSTAHNYEEVSISDLSPGPRRVTFTCRVVNIYSRTISSKIPQSARGCLKLLVKDESATILIKLWYATTSYDLRLGTLITCWTTHIHSTSSLAGINESLTPPSSPIVTSIFPERDSGCDIQIHNEDNGRLSACCRTPLGYFSGDPLPGLMSLDQYINGGSSDVAEARLLVCVVAIGEPTMVTTKTGAQFPTLPITITDASVLRAALSLSAPLFPSATSWLPNSTILLLSSPRLLPSNRIIPTPRSHIDVDPSIGEAVTLRKHIQRGHCPINAPFPVDVFDVAAIEQSPTRLQFTLQTLSEFVDADADEMVAGYLSVILSRVDIMGLVARRRLFSMECCGMPVYGNDVRGRCGQCGQMVELRVNPDVVGEMADETGAVGCGGSPYSNPRTSGKRKKQQQHSSVLWSDEAWCQLLGRDMEELAEFAREDVNEKTRKGNLNVLRYLEQRLLWMRVVLLIGWTGEALGGKLAVLRVVA